jgi:hypothetical protein
MAVRPDRIEWLADGTAVEYRRLASTGDPRRDIRRREEMALAGWELVCAVAGDSRTGSFDKFRRPVIKPKEARS